MLLLNTTSIIHFSLLKIILSECVNVIPIIVTGSLSHVYFKFIQ